MRRPACLSLLLLSLLELVHLKIYDPCEFAQVLTNEKYNVSFWQIPTWTCIGFQATGLNTSYNKSGYHGLFRISGVYWCEQCNTTCDKLTDDDLTDDLACAVHIYNRHNNERSSGFRTWGTFYSEFCMEPWKYLKDHDCHKFWKFLLLRVPKVELDRHNEAVRRGQTTENVLEANTIEVSIPEMANATNSSNSTSRDSGWAVHHLLLSDAGMLILVLLLIFIVAGLVEVWRRYELPFSTMRA